MKLFLGIDPGISGAWVVINESAKIQLLGTWSDRQQFLKSCAATMIEMAALEKVHSMPRQGVVSTFTFGQNFGWWIGVLDTLRTPYILISPQKWQGSSLDVAITKIPPPPDEDEKDRAKRVAANKLALKTSVVEFCKRRFPDILPEYLTVKRNWGLADAACLALYALTTYRASALDSSPEQ